MDKFFTFMTTIVASVFTVIAVLLPMLNPFDFPEPKLYYETLAIGVILVLLWGIALNEWLKEES